jgi:uncharacterized membrane protein required for colicin V production
VNAVDVVILAVLVVGTLVGLVRGLIVQVALMLGALAALLVARLAYPSLRHVFLFTHINHRWLTVISYLIIFFVVWSLIVAAATRVRFLARLFLLGCFDRIGGAIVGFVQAVLVLVLLLYLGQRVPNHQLHSQIAHSRLASPLLHAIPSLARLFPRVA